MKRIAYSNRAQAMTEFALTLVLFLILILVITDLGRITYVYSNLHNAAREGARYGIINPDSNAQIENHLKNYLAGMDESNLTTTITRPTDTDFLRVVLQYEFETASPILRLLTGSQTFTLTATSQMIIEE